MALCIMLLQAPKTDGAVQASKTNPIAKVLEMISDLEAKIIKEGTDSAKLYDEFAEDCEDRSRDLHNDIKTGKAEVAELKATIDTETTKAEAEATKIEELAAAVTSDQKDLKAAREIREKENSDFLAEETDLKETIDVLHRAIGILEKEMSFVQTKSATNLVDALKVLIQAASFSSADRARLTSLVQSSSQAEDGGEDTGAPDPDAYQNHSGGIVDVMEGLLDKAEAQLQEARNAEAKALGEFELMEQTLQDRIRNLEGELAESKKDRAAALEAASSAEGDLTTTTRTLEEQVSDLADLHQECMERATDYEAETKSRSEELKALASAKKIIVEATSELQEAPAQDEDSDLSLLQVAASEQPNYQALKYFRRLARKMRSPALAQLALRVSAVLRGHETADPFAKVKDLIQGLLDKLIKEAEKEATHKAYCDKEMSETKVKKEDKEDEIAKLSAKIDKDSARSAKLKKQVAGLQKSLGDLAASQAEMDKLRLEEHDFYVAAKEETTKGLTGIQLALKVLRDYYSKDDKDHDAAEGAGSGIIGLLEVCESDFTKSLTELEATEETSAATYEKQTKENEIMKTTMEQDVKFKSKEATELDAAVSEDSSDRSGVMTELDAVNEYLAKITDKCVAKPEPYEVRVKRREAEIAGLKEGLAILEGESVLLQESSVRRLRGPHGA